MSLEEIENSVQFGKRPRRRALEARRRAQRRRRHDPLGLRPVAGPGEPAAHREQDVIRTAFIYNPQTVQPVGSSVVLADQSDPGEPFDNAREPLAQEFKRKGALDSDGFLVVVNHLKSKGDSTPAATGDNANGIQGAFNGDRVRQAHALVDFANRSRRPTGHPEGLPRG